MVDRFGEGTCRLQEIILEYSGSQRLWSGTGKESMVKALVLSFLEIAGK